MAEPYNPYAGQTLSPYEPTWRDRLARMMLGEQPSFEKRKQIEGLLGSSGLGDTGMSLVDFTGLGGLLDAQTQAAAGDYRSAAMAMVPGMKQAKAVGNVVETAAEAAARQLSKQTPLPAINNGNVEQNSSAIAEAMQKYFGVPVSVSKSKTAYGESHYVQPKFDIPRDEVPFSIRISDHAAWAPRPWKVEHQIYPKLEDDVAQHINSAIEAAKQYGQRVNIFPKDEFVPLKGEVYHQTYGKGTVISSQPDMAKIDFGSNGVRNISSRFLQESPFTKNR